MDLSQVKELLDRRDDELRRAFVRISELESKAERNLAGIQELRRSVRNIYWLLLVVVCIAAVHFAVWYLFDPGAFAALRNSGVLNVPSDFEQ